MKTRLTKKYYVPGLISALLIPLVFWFYGNRKLQEPLPNVIDLHVSSKYNPNMILNKRFSFEIFRNWDYKKIKVVPNAKENSNFYVSEIKSLQERNEKNTGIEFILDDENSYNDFVSILNDLAISKHEIYGWDLDKTGHIFALVDFHNPLAKDDKLEEGLLTNCLVVTYVDEGATFESMFLYPVFENYKALLQTLTKESVYLLFGFLILLNVTVLNIKKFI